jgi:hypothetical protein
MTMAVVGWYYGQAERDADGNRDYKLVAHCRTDLPYAEGPSVAMQLVNALVPLGQYWNPPGGAAEVDVWAYRRLETTVRPVLAENEVNQDYYVDLTFSTKNDPKWCKDQQIDDPLLQPQRVSGNFTRYTEEAVLDRFGRHITNSAHEQIRGPQNEWDRNRPGVKIEQNVADLEFPRCSSFVDCVNDSVLWGLPPRTIKLSAFDWEVKYYGLCSKYYVRKFDFEINYDGWDRDLLDEGTKALHGRWQANLDQWQLIPINGRAPNPANPQHFDRYKDRNGENARVVLNGAGVPISTDDFGTSTSTSTAPYRYPGTIHVEKYLAANFLLLNIPTSF